MTLTDDQRRLLLALSNGHTLKVHRDIDGGKVYRLHNLDGDSRPIERAVADDLIERGLLGSNQKFPAATFWLTAAGRAQLADRIDRPDRPETA
jgi:hypothetical protein